MKLERLEELLASLQALISLSTPRRSIEAKHLAEELAFFCQNAIYSEEQLYARTTSEIFRYVQKALSLPRELQRYDVPVAALKFIAKCGDLVASYLLEDYHSFYQSLKKWCLHQNVTVRKTAFSALCEFLRRVSSGLTQGVNKEASSSVFLYFIKEFKDVMNSASSSRYENEMAIRGYGYFAAPCLLYMREEEVYYMFHDVAQQAVMFFSAGTSHDSLTEPLPAYMESIGSALHALPRADDAVLVRLDAVLETFFKHFRFVTASHFLVRYIFGFADGCTYSVAE
ncbi:DNA-dependent protein kinase catalytic subunit-like [Zophobas morio]|uniref:DNA-dependent protein kinase catalytic subunit-like n=1 Tax=Zophobas morio TaxID=2755281 RepID=UPI00308379FF